MLVLKSIVFLQLFYLKHLSEDCKVLLHKSSPIFGEVIIDAIDDPRYHLAENPEAFSKGLEHYKL